jgi:hypothetical protein
MARGSKVAEFLCVDSSREKTSRGETSGSAAPAIRMNTSYFAV